MADRDRVEKVEITVPPGMSEEFHAAALAAGWTDDPGTGKAIMIEDRSRPDYGSEILNPTPMAPPVGYEPGDTLEDMVRRHMQKMANMQGFDGNEIIDDEATVDDFEVEDELPDLHSIYEVKEMVEESPSLSDYFYNALERQRKEREEAAKPPPPVVEEKGKGA